MKFVAAFDVDAKKVGFDLSEAIFASREQHHQDRRRAADQRHGAARPDPRRHRQVLRRDHRGVRRRPGRRREGAARTTRSTSWCPTCRWAPRRPTSSTRSARIDAGVAFVNALPVFIASDPVWAKKFEDAGVPIVGDDIKSQVGATITHRVMAKLFEDRGVQLDRTMQLNVGGNMDFLNMLERRAPGVEEDLQDAGGHVATCSASSRPRTCTSARPTTSAGSTTASGPTCGWRAARSATCR